MNWGGSESYVDYEKMYMSRYKLLRKAYERADLSKDEDYADFLKEEQKLADRLLSVHGDQE